MIIDLQNASSCTSIPTPQQFHRWAETVLADHEITIRIVDKPESAALNEKFRKKSGPTNVLSFPFAHPESCSPPLLGDLVICAPLVEEEAAAQKKTIEEHW